jgi:hypothetical protein
MTVPRLPLVRYRFIYRALDAGAMRGFGGSAWRGGFGAALKRVVCAMRLRPCAGCPLIDGCTYPGLFEGHRPFGAAQFPGVERLAVPYVFAPENRAEFAFASGDEVTTVLTLVGHANSKLVYVVRAMADAGLAGLGPARARLELLRVEAVQTLEPVPEDSPEASSGDCILYEAGGACSAAAPRSPVLGAPCRRVEVELRTPLRLRLADDLVTPARFQAAHLLIAAIRRVSTLAALHGDGPIEADYAALKGAAATATLEGAALRWQEQTRFSARHRSTMQQGGILGTCRIDLGADAVQLFPWLALAQWVGAGKSASMGLGQIRIQAAG